MEINLGRYWKAIAETYRSSANGTGATRGNGTEGSTSSTEDPAPLPCASLEVGEIIAYRFWFMSHGYLRSIRMGNPVVWAPGEAMIGEVFDYGQSGVYSWKTKSMALSHALQHAEELVVIVGSVAIWGEVVEHQYGYRSQFAKIVSFDYADVSNQTGTTEGDEKNSVCLERLRKLYLGSSQ